ncbi:MurR/RpiR family transcriptional regulator [Cetobacterium sp.]|uniref:MurR/RpiR family transcriptional regulator n=1 Tax=Cetobacterium sp. TaxID=2071632 RepID=UPI003AF04D30
MIDVNYICKKHKLTILEKSILEFIVQNIQDKKRISIRNVALENFTSTSVIYKCVNKIGYTSYSNFIYFLKTNNNSLISKNYPLEENDSFKKAISLFKQNKDKLFMFTSTGIANNISSYMNERLALLGIRSISNGHIQLLETSFTKDVILITLSQSGETESVIDILKIANRNQIKSISFIGKKDTTIESVSDVSLISNSDIFFADVITIFEEILKRL